MNAILTPIHAILTLIHAAATSGGGNHAMPTHVLQVGIPGIVHAHGGDDTGVLRLLCERHPAHRGQLRGAHWLAFLGELVECFGPEAAQAVLNSDFYYVIYMFSVRKCG